MGLKYNEITGEFEEEKEQIGYGDLVFNPITGEFEPKSTKKDKTAQNNILLKELLSPIIKFDRFFLGKTLIYDIQDYVTQIIPGCVRYKNAELSGSAFLPIESVKIHGWNFNNFHLHSFFLTEKTLSEWLAFLKNYTNTVTHITPTIYISDTNTRYFSGTITAHFADYNLKLQLRFFQHTNLYYYDELVQKLSLFEIELSYDNLEPCYFHDWFYENVPIIRNIPFVLSDDGKTIVKYTGDDEKVVIPDGIENIANSVFFKNLNIKEVLLPNSLKRIGNTAFWGCENLKSIKLPTHLTEIENDAFLYSGLEEIVIPGSVTHIGNNAFRCPVKVRTNNKIYNSYEGALYSKDYKILYMYPIISEVSVTLHDKTEVISSDSFVNCTFMHLVIPKNVRKFSNSCFKDCTSLKNLTLLSENLYGIDFEYNPLSKIKRYSKVHCLYVLGSQLKAAKVSSEFTKFEKILPIPGTEVLDIISTSRIKSMMFPIDGLSIFNDTYRSELSYEKVLDKYIRTPEGHKFILRDGLVTGVVIGRASSIPGAWTRLGLDWKLSFSKSVECLKKIGFNVTSQRWKAKTNEHYNRQYLVGEIKAETLEKDLNVTLKFDWDDEHPYSAPSTLDGPNGLTEISIIYK